MRRSRMNATQKLIGKGDGGGKGSSNDDCNMHQAEGVC